MTVYKKYQSQPFKLMLAVLVFVLAMSVTIDDVYGIQVSNTEPSATGTQTTQSYDVTSSATDAGSTDGTFQDTDPLSMTVVSPVPEPSSLIFIAMGLGSMYAMRSRRKVK